MMTFHGEDVPQSAPDKALFHVIPVPYEKTVSYGHGTADGPEAILEASAQLELFDGFGIPAERGIHTTAPVDCSGGHEEALARVQEAVLAALDCGAIPAVLGGEHTISAPTARALKMRHGSFGVVHFDAHADLRDTYEGTPHSHACAMRRVHELGIPLYQIGTRGYCLEEHRYRIEKRIPYVDARELHSKGCEAVRLPDDFPEQIFISFDLDAFDSSFMPATGTPVPGGLFWHQARTCLERVMQGRRCIGFDVVELAPMPGLSAPNFAAAQLVYDIMGLIDRSGASGR